jgi:oligoendopeptidase F
MKLATSTPEGYTHAIPLHSEIQNWDNDLLPLFTELLHRPINSTADLEQWVADKSALDAFLSETFSRKYIRLSQNNKDAEAIESYRFAIQHIYPNITLWEQKLNAKLITCPFTDELPADTFAIYLRMVNNACQIFKEENVPLLTQVQLQTKEYGRIFSQMTVGLDGKQMTLQKAGFLLEEHDRSKREKVYQKINERILEDSEHLEDLFDTLLLHRHQLATNAGFKNYRDFAFRQLNRFDYSPRDCQDLHSAIIAEILPILDELNEIRRQKLNLDTLRPWDLNVDVMGDNPLKPFNNTPDLLEKSIQCLSNIYPQFGTIVSMMKAQNLLDIESRPGKSPGGYNIPLQVQRMPFIFMNATGSLNDVRTLMHESGHAIHFFLTRDFKLLSARRFPSEVSELAAMTMELLAMDHWDVFFPKRQELLRARINQIENVLKVLPWIVAIDKFQHWLYLNPHHSRAERKENWLQILQSCSSSVIDFTDLNRYQEFLWHKQLHIFEAPFYYIEYAIAQLGAIAIWKQYRQNPEKAVHDYINAMKIGNTKPIKAVYQAAGIEFRFDREYISALANFACQEIHMLTAQLDECREPASV